MILSLVLIAIAPVFLNSDKPIFGFIIWLAVPTTLCGSGIYAGIRINDAIHAKKLLTRKFPEYRHLPITKFLDLSSDYVEANLEMLELAQSDPDFQNLNISLFDLLNRDRKP